MGIQTGKDIDFAVEASSYDEMRSSLILNGLRIYVGTEKPEFGRLRGQYPLNNVHESFRSYFPNPERLVVDADFTLCREDGLYSDGRRPDGIVPTDIHTDLCRRDFTVNAIAVSEDGEVIDPHDGELDCELSRLRCVRNTRERMIEDSLRLLRALRFIVTHQLEPISALDHVLDNPEIVERMDNLSSERIETELQKMFTHDTTESLRVLYRYPQIMFKCFSRKSRIWLKPTTKERSMSDTNTTDTAGGRSNKEST